MNCMKKILLSGFVVVVFAAYAIHQQTEGSNAGNVIAPAQSPLGGVQTTPSAAATPSSSGSSTPPIQSGQTLPSSTPTQTRGQYKDGSYTGSVADAFYGNIQVKAVISGGKITDVQFLQYPSDRNTSIEINTQAMPYLKQEAIAAQNAQVDIVSGATDSSQAFRQSLQSALDQAKS